MEFHSTQWGIVNQKFILSDNSVGKNKNPAGIYSGQGLSSNQKTVFTSHLVDDLYIVIT
jgi:hypothetical protein